MELVDMVKRIKDLPTLPSVVLKVNRALSDVSVTAGIVSDIIEKDSSLTSRVLRLANSSYYGLSYRVDTITKAITVLGFNTVRNLALTASVSDLFGNTGDGDLDGKGLWFHSLGCAIASKSLANTDDSILSEKAFICGLLHDIGKLIMLQNMKEEIRDVYRKLGNGDGTSQCDLEGEVAGFTHTEVGSLVVKKWHFPGEYLEAIKYHHSLHDGNSSLLEKKQGTSGRLICSVYAGNQVAKALSLGKSSDDMIDTIPPYVWDHLGITEELLPSSINQIMHDFEEVVTTFDLE